MTPEELQEAKRLILVLDTQIEMLQARHARQFARFLENPSKDNFYMLATNESGVARMDTDATFVAEKLFLDARTDPTNFQDDNSALVNGVIPDIQIYDRSSGRSLAESTDVNFEAVQDLAANVAPGTSQFTPSDFGHPLIGIPTFPGSTAGAAAASGMQAQVNTDFQRTFPVEFEVPRGGIVSIRFRTQYGQFLAYPLVLIGYKVY